MIPQIAKRRIGNVMIIDINGTLSGSWALRGKEKFSQMLASGSDQKVIFNLRGVTSMDTLGAKSLFESVSHDTRGGILCGNAGVRDLMDQFPESKRFRVFRNEEEIVSVFGRDLVPVVNSREQRISSRTETAFPIEFGYEEEGEKIQFRAIVTNLSEGGLFAEYIDLKIAEDSLNRLDPYDLKDLHLKLLLPNRKPIYAEGKVAYRKLDGEQVGIGLEFTKIGSKEREEVRRFLKLYGSEKEMLNPLSQERKEF